MFGSSIMLIAAVVLASAGILLFILSFILRFIEREKNRTSKIYVSAVVSGYETKRRFGAAPEAQVPVFKYRIGNSEYQKPADFSNKLVFAKKGDTVTLMCDPSYLFSYQLSH